MRRYVLGGVQALALLCAIPVRSEPVVWKITAEAGPNGVIMPAGEVPVVEGSNQTFTIQGETWRHGSAEVLVDGKSVGSPRICTLTNVTGPHTVKALFRPNLVGRGPSCFRPTVFDQDHHLDSWHKDANGPFEYPVFLCATWWKTAPEVNGWPIWCTAAEVSQAYATINGATPGSVCSLGILSCLKLYLYTGDPAYSNMAVRTGNYIVQQALTPASCRTYPGFPYAIGKLGDVHPNGYGHAINANFNPVGHVQPDKGAMLGVALLELYKVTGTPAYLKTAVNIADCLAHNAVAGSATNSPWPLRVDADTGAVRSGRFCANVSFACRLFDGLLQLGQAGNGKYRSTRSDVWAWLKTNVMAVEDASRWQLFFEDHGGIPNSTQLNALETVRYLLERKSEADPDWLKLAGTIIEQSYNRWHITTIKDDGYVCIAEQDNDRRPYNSHTARLGSIYAMYYEAGGAASFKDLAYHSLCYGLYSVKNNGFTDTYFGDGWAWTSDSFADFLCHYMDAFAAVPEWAGNDRNHLLRSSGTVKEIRYGGITNVAYSVFDRVGSETLKLVHSPVFVTVDGKKISSCKWNSATRLLEITRTGGVDVVIGLYDVENGSKPDERTSQVRPVDSKWKDQSGALGREIHYYLQKQVGADLEVLCRNGSVRKKSQSTESSSYCFPIKKTGERVAESQIRPLGSLVLACAVLLRYGEYDPAAVGFEKEDLEQMMVALAAEIAKHHAANNDKTGWWWGDDWQSALWTAYLGEGAWLMWDKLPVGARKHMTQMIIHEADRFIGKPAPFNEFDDTRAEENAWNSKILTLAYAMFPDHPHYADWRQKSMEYMVTSYAAPQDLQSGMVVDGKPLKEWLRGPNAHPDYTVENHGFTHPDYQACFGLMIDNVLTLQLAGETIPQSCYFNVDKCAGILDLLVMPSGWLFYPQSTDWSNYRHDVLLMKCCMNPLVSDSFCAQDLRWMLDYLHYADSLSDKTSHVSLFKFNWTCSPSVLLAHAYLMHSIFGSGAKPAGAEAALRGRSDSRIYEQGKYVICRTATGISSFSWFDSGNRLMGVVTPLDVNTLAVPVFRNLVGFVEGGGNDRNRPDPVNLTRHEVRLLPGGGFTAGFSAVRGWNKELDERMVMIALPDGRTVYLESFHANGATGQAVTVPASRTGLICMEADPDYRRGVEDLTVQYADGRYGGRHRRQDKLPSYTLQGANARWLNIGGRFGIVMRGNEAVDLCDSNHRLELTLNRRSAKECNAGAVVSTFCAVFYPKATRDQTAKNDDIVTLKDGPDGMMIVNIGDKRLLFNLSDKSGCVKVSDKMKDVPSLAAVVTENLYE